IPGWQHIGDEGWKDQAIENTREMVLQYRNHPSIILWGVRINESMDDDDFYARTNKLAHELDPSRMTGGVRYIKNSHLLEDVYTFNDFSCDSMDKKGVLSKKEVGAAPEKALLVTENNGHMFPTKSYDHWGKRQEHALRHAKVQGAALSSPEHAGCFAWCMFDYQTHQDFGSGDRICYHGVMDAFRNPKLAAAVYASQGEEKPVLEVGSGMAIGDYPAGTVGDIYLFTNADSVKLYKNDKFVAEFTPKPFTGLKHEPILADDTVGELLRTEEGFGRRKADMVRDCLLAASKYGLEGLPLGKKIKFAWTSLVYRLKFEDAYALYGKYVGNWGQATPVWRFDAIRNGVVVASSCKAQSRILHLEAKPSKTVLTEGDTHDCAAVRIRLLDEYDNVANYAQAPVGFTVEGPIEIIGPAVATAEGGMCGTYVRTTGEKGEAKLHITCTDAGPIDVMFEVK
ncbi:MAG: glycoside hydrolase family 2 protein, partial [Lachnospiraceae bacterium]|nr:glycoside hydrolase family 2 protein [Lachnospiraceae bacterium]